MSRLPALLVRHPPLAEIASGYRQRHAGDIAGLIAGEKQDRIRLFRQRAVPVQQTARHRLIDDLLIPRLFLLARLLFQEMFFCAASCCALKDINAVPFFPLL